MLRPSWALGHASAVVGAFEDDHASLGHRRLSIIDRDGGHQPMSNEDGTVHVVFNGEIYNHRELADVLRSRGHRLSSQCDTEVIAHLGDHSLSGGGQSIPSQQFGVLMVSLPAALQ